MPRETSPKVTAEHLNRKAYLYVRQSTPRQVLENIESTQRQYALRQRAVALGWPEARVVVIDADQGISGASAVDRAGFQRLVAEVSLGQAGIVMGLEVSRLARNSTDWHRLLEMCAFTRTLILDEDGIYDPTDFNDRLLLGLKGTMSEAELHLIQARLRGGIINKARRGAFPSRLPVGFVYDADRNVRLDPDQQVRDTLALFFETFRRLGTAYGTVRHFRDAQIPFPRSEKNWADQCTVTWVRLNLGMALSILHNPRYAGAYCFGRRRVRKRLDGGTVTHDLPPEEWTALVRDAHEGYLTWEEFTANQVRLRQNLVLPEQVGGATLAREGAGLLQGLVVCGLCGKPMRTLYHCRGGQGKADYVCRTRDPSHTKLVCQSMVGTAIDAAVGALVVEAVTPEALAVSLAVQDELVARAEEVERLRRQQVDRCAYEAELARRRFMRVDPDNRLVAETLEAEWNAKLLAQADAHEAYERHRLADGLALDAVQRAGILALATDFPRLWQDPATPMRERKRMLRLLLEDATLLKQDKTITVHLRFKGGAIRTLTVPAPQLIWETQATSREVVEAIDRLLETHPEYEVAVLLNAHGYQSSSGKPFTVRMVEGAARKYGLTSHYQRLREQGFLTVEEMAERLGVYIDTVKTWRRAGLLRGRQYNIKGKYLYEPPGEHAPSKQRGIALKHRTGADAQDTNRELHDSTLGGAV